ncbi:sodium/solute symporter [Aureliella helgolandensis]|uniref:Cation/acetate symporter ActP n=1 Tax=Aureliella helgolandensis TaxID=2527968 RepID=A0A518GFL4_9BACT|nr:cation acetate symporter [Aureliella helgolandensis]QDV27350.1 Cation/acetate symporter ActP [Aureliella helgolandensis]
MIHETSTIAVVIFLAFVGVTLGISFYLGSKAKSSAGYFTAHGQIPWFVNGIAFAGDYLSAASFLGICGMIAFYGYDGFLYSIGYLAGWIVALFVIAEPMKRLGKFTFADALNANYNSRGIQLAAGISTLAVSVFYLIPQMVGAGVLVQPLLGYPHWAGVTIVGTVVILIVVTAGMVSTTWVQFLKGSLLVLFSAILTVAILQRGFEVTDGGIDGYEFTNLTLQADSPLDEQLAALGHQLQPLDSDWLETPYVRIQMNDQRNLVFRKQNSEDPSAVLLAECQEVRIASDGQTWINGELRTTDEEAPLGSSEESSGEERKQPALHPVGTVSALPNGEESTGPIGPLSFFKVLSKSQVVLWGSDKLTSSDGSSSTIYFPKPTPGSHVLRPGEHPKFAGIRQDDVWPKLNFLSLMLALFCGTASLPHILIRYYTVKDASAARKSTIVGIATIGFFYILTLYLGLGAMTSGAMDVTNSNMAAPLLARSINEWLFAIISAIAFTTVLGTVSGLILASAGAVSHDLMKNVMRIEMSDSRQVQIAKLASVVVGIIAIVLGIVFEKMNVSYLVGWAFSVAASANLPALVMLLFWKRTTSQGIIAGILVGMSSSLAWILLSSDTFSQVYSLERPEWLAMLVPFSQPGIVTIPLSFIVLVIVSLMTSKTGSATPQ